MLAPKGVLSLSPAKTVGLPRGEMAHPTRGDPVDGEQYGSRPEMDKFAGGTLSSSHQYQIQA